MLYKVLDANGQSCNGGTLQWSLPTQNPDGSWVPGDWMPMIKGKLIPCKRGYHAAKNEQIIKWLNARIFELEIWPQSEQLDVNDKVVLRGPVRLVREFTNWNDRTTHIFAVWCARAAAYADADARTNVRTAQYQQFCKLIS